MIFGIVIPVLLSCSNNAGDSRKEHEVVATARNGEHVATFAAGCFWSTEEIFENVKGVNRVVSGYAGGSGPDPDYKTVGAGKTGHAETVQVYYDSAAVDYPTLLKVFFLGAHDPTQLNRQGPDIGPQYRSVVFYRSDQERTAAASYIGKLEASGKFEKPVVTQIVPFEDFYPAEAYHQDYYTLNPGKRYIKRVSKPKVDKFKENFRDIVKEDRP